MGCLRSTYSPTNRICLTLLFARVGRSSIIYFQRLIWNRSMRDFHSALSMHTKHLETAQSKINLHAECFGRKEIEISFYYRAFFANSIFQPARNEVSMCAHGQWHFCVRSCSEQKIEIHEEKNMNRI